MPLVFLPAYTINKEANDANDLLEMTLELLSIKQPDLIPSPSTVTDPNTLSPACSSSRELYNVKYQLYHAGYE